MTGKKLGRQTALLTEPVSVLSGAGIVGRKEGSGPLAACFDEVDRDDTFGEATWERAERAMQKRALDLAL